jgi:hypothetical protein
LSWSVDNTKKLLIFLKAFGVSRLHLFEKSTPISTEWLTAVTKVFLRWLQEATAQTSPVLEQFLKTATEQEEAFNKNAR